MDGSKQAFNKRQRVLIVEAEQALRSELQDIVEKLGAMVVVPERCIDDAIEIMKEGSVDVAVLDTGINGGKLSLLAKSCQKRRIPFALITTYGGFEFEDSALDTAPRIYRPLDEMSVRTIVARALHDRLACTH